MYRRWFRVAADDMYGYDITDTAIVDFFFHCGERRIETLVEG